MLRLDTTTRSLEIQLAGAVTTNQLPVVVCYSDQTASSYNGNTQLSNTTDTTPVTIVSAPGASTNRDVDYLSVWNRDTASATVIITLNDNGTLYTVARITLAVGEQLIYTHGEGWRSITVSGQLKTAAGGGGGSVALDDLTDVTITSATHWDLLQYTTNNLWENAGHVTLREITPPATPPADTTRIFADDEKGFPVLRSIGPDGVTTTFQRDNWFIVRNVTGSTILRGTPVHIDGAASSAASIAPAQADNDATMPCVGLAYEDIANNSFGRILILGDLIDFDTSAWSAGDRLYVSATTAGTLTSTPPPFPFLRQAVAIVAVSGVGNGVLVVDPQAIRRIHIAACRAATTGNISLAAPGATIDGVSLAVGDRVLVWQQTTPSENGVYDWQGAATPMVRSTDFSEWSEVIGRTFIISEGTLYDRSAFSDFSEYTGTIDTTAITILPYVKRVGPGAQFDLGDSWTTARANNANGPRGFSLIDTNGVVRVWRYTGGGGSPGIEFIKGLADDPGDLANDWWDIVLDTAAGTGVRFAQRSTGVTDLKMFVSTSGVRVGTDIAATDTTVAFEVESTDAMLAPVGTTAQRPTGVEGYLRYNSTTDKFEGFENSAWRSLVTASAGGATLQLYRENFTGTPTLQATGTNSQAFGDGASASLYGAFTDSNGSFAAVGDAQTTSCVLRCTTTNTAATTEMFLDGAGATARMVLPNDTTWTFEILVTARRTDVDGTSAGYRFIGVIDRNTTAGSTALVGTVSKTVLAEDNASYDCNVNADTTNGALRIQVNGVGTHTVRWVAFVRLVEVTG